MASRDATPIVVSAQERTALETWVRAPTTERRLVERARIVLLAADGMASRAIAREVGCGRGVISRWRVRFARDRLAGLADAPRSGKPRRYGEAADGLSTAGVFRRRPSRRTVNSTAGRSTTDAGTSMCWTFAIVI